MKRYVRRSLYLVAPILAWIFLSGFFFFIPLPGNQDGKRFKEMEQKGDWKGMLELAEDRLKPSAPTQGYAGESPGAAPQIDYRYMPYKGYALLKLERYEESVAAYKQYLAQKPDDIIARSNLASSESKLKRHQEAIADYEQILKARPDLPRVWYALGENYFASGNMAKVAEIQSEIEKRDSALGQLYKQNFLTPKPAPPTAAATPAATATSSAANAPTENSKPTAPDSISISAAQQEVAKDPNSADGWASLAKAYAIERKMPEAKRAIQEAMRLQPQSLNAIYEYGHIQYLDGDKDKVREVYQQINLRDPERGQRFFKEFVLPQ